MDSQVYPISNGCSLRFTHSQLTIRFATGATLEIPLPTLCVFAVLCFCMQHIWCAFALKCETISWSDNKTGGNIKNGDQIEPRGFLTYIMEITKWRAFSEGLSGLRGRTWYIIIGGVQFLMVRFICSIWYLCCKRRSNDVRIN